MRAVLTSARSVCGDPGAESVLGGVDCTPMSPPDISPAPAGMDGESRNWLERLRGAERGREAALTDHDSLRALLLSQTADP